MQRHSKSTWNAWQSRPPGSEAADGSPWLKTGKKHPAGPPVSTPRGIGFAVSGYWAGRVIKHVEENPLH